MSGKHRRPQPDALAEVDLAERLAVGGDRAEAPPEVLLPEPGAASGAEAAAAPAAEVAADEPSHPSRRSHRAPGPPAESAAPIDPVVPAAGAAVGIPGTGRPTRASRAAAREARRREARRKQLIGGGAAVALLLVGVAGWWLIAGRGGDDPVETRTGPARQQTLLVQVAAADGVAAASAVMGVSQDEAAEILVPSRLIVDVAGSGTLPFGETLALPDERASAGALTDLLGIRVQDSWVLTGKGLAAAVDQVGGVQADVDVDVIRTDAKGDRTVVVRAGTQELSGAAASAYATYLAEDEPEQARLARFNEVLDGLLRGLPDETAAVAAALEKVGPESSSTLPQGRLAAVLTQLHTAATGDGLAAENLPVNEIDTGGSVQAYGLDAGKADTLLKSRFAGAQLRDPAGESVRVLVQNGVGTPGLVERARTRLVEDGFRFVNGGNAGTFGLEASTVQIPEGSKKSQDRGRRVAASLGLPSDSVELAGQGQTVADVIVILGSDFTP